MDCRHRGQAHSYKYGFWRRCWSEHKSVVGAWLARDGGVSAMLMYQDYRLREQARLWLFPSDERFNAPQTL